MYSVIFISTKSRRSNLTILTVEGEQTVVCAPIIYLTVNVVGDLTNVPTEWVQISGSPTVTIETVSQTEAYYLAGTNVGTDKTFRFYIHRNTSLEQYVDLIIRTTPFSTVSTIENGNLINEVPALPFTLIEPFVLTGDFPFSIVPFNAQIKELGINDTVTTWKLPAVFYQNSDPSTDTYKQGFQGTQLQQFNGVSWTNVQFFSPTDARQIPLTEPLRLRVGSQFKLLGKEPFIVYNPWVDLVPGGTVSVLGKEVLATIENGQLRRNVTLERIVYRLELQDCTDEIPRVENGQVINQVTLGRVVYVLDQQNYTDEIPTVQHGLLKHTVTLSRVSGGVIGG